jgi:hypothetical protein
VDEAALGQSVKKFGFIGAHVLGRGLVVSLWRVV